MRRQRALVTEAGRRFDGIAQRFLRTGKLSNGASASAVAALGSDLEIYFLCELVDGRETALPESEPEPRAICPPSGKLRGITRQKRRSVEQGRQRQDHRSVGRPRRRCGPHPLRPRPLRAGAELPPRRIISVTVARVFKDCVKDFHEFRQPTTTKGQHGNQSRENDAGFCV
jgi:hypothetical protein